MSTDGQCVISLYYIFPLRSRDSVPVPEVLDSKSIAHSRFFNVEARRLRFSNGEERDYERLPKRGREAVIVCAFTDDGHVILVREYVAGFHRYELLLPKGTVEPDESFEEAANRELKEEAGFGSRQLDYIREITIAPSHMGFSVHVVVARNLYPESLPGDEPEPPEVVLWPVADIDELIFREELTEARSIAALKLAQLTVEKARAQ